MQSPIINGDGTYSRDFTYIDNVIHANERACLTTKDEYLNGLKKYFGKYNNELIFEVFNVAYGENTTLNELFNIIKTNLVKFDKSILNIVPNYGPNRQSDVPHSLASVEKAKDILNYYPKFNAHKGFELVCE